MTSDRRGIGTSRAPARTRGHTPMAVETQFTIQETKTPLAYICVWKPPTVQTVVGGRSTTPARLHRL